MQHVYVMTTTLPDGSFDIFRWTAWRAEASLIQLYFSFGQMETLELAYQLRIERGEGDEIENALKVEFYLSLQADILTEIAVRLTPTGYRSLN